MLEFVLDGDARLRQLKRILSHEQHDTAWFEAQQHFESIDGYSAKARAAQLLKRAGLRQLGYPATYADCSSDFIANLNVRREILETKVVELEEGWLEMEMSLEGTW